MEGLQDEIISEVLNKYDNQKLEFIKQKFAEKGYTDIIDNLNACRFPKVNVSKHGNWEYYFADNGTKQGDFIVAIKEPDFYTSPDLLNYSCKIDLSFQWQDTDYSAVRIY